MAKRSDDVPTHSRRGAMTRHLELTLGDALFETMLGEYQELAERIGDAMQARLPAYRLIPRQTLAAEVGLQAFRPSR